MSLASLCVSGYEMRKAFHYRHLRQHGLLATATVLTARPVSVLHNYGIRLDVHYRDSKNRPYQACLVAPDAEDRFTEYQAGDQVFLRYHQQRPALCELEEVLDTPWWRGPLVPAILLGGAGCYFLWEAISSFLK
ncbi:hypothetical protein PK28_17085 (plasmid) [Hymenobacter sp. DG25B]|uniref:DUF3592 domain-containing protein n=1 Tax=Hymenobacter sp. DG25B TaxID=1385664 RepID=UPI000540BB92|nr:DUF3592 domain-containing protein [Hymenobacter sp. DG25B]AIZ65387.1 hypothetical protein PK28_17085 [Hymenobacter sp. DG25B]